MKKLISISIISYILLVFAFPLALSGQDEENNPLNEFVGTYTYSVIIGQPGLTSMSLGKLEIQLIDPDTIKSEFSNHDIKFILTYSPLKKIYSFTYVFKKQPELNVKTLKYNKPEPLFSINNIELIYSEEEGYTYSESKEEEDWSLEVTIKVEENKIKSTIKSIFEGKTYDHHLNFSREDS